MMLDNMQVAEVLARAKQRDIERAVERYKLLAQIDAPKHSLHPRQAIAAVLMRLAMVIDEGAGGRTTATAAQ